jgi:hypothetical protein
VQPTINTKQNFDKYVGKAEWRIILRKARLTKGCHASDDDDDVGKVYANCSLI